MHTRKRKRECVRALAIIADSCVCKNEPLMEVFESHGELDKPVEHLLLLDKRTLLFGSLNLLRQVTALAVLCHNAHKVLLNVALVELENVWVLKLAGSQHTIE